MAIFFHSIYTRAARHAMQAIERDTRAVADVVKSQSDIVTRVDLPVHEHSRARIKLSERKTHAPLPTLIGLIHEQLIRGKT